MSTSFAQVFTTLYSETATYFTSHVMNLPVFSFLMKNARKITKYLSPSTINRNSIDSGVASSQGFTIFQ